MTINKLSRYVPFTQQNYCCVTACLQMIMYRRGISLVSQEELAFDLGLTVPESDRWLFNRAYTATTMPTAGWGTRIGQPGSTLGELFKKRDIPLYERFELVDNALDIESGVKWLRTSLSDIESSDLDALVCFRYGVLYDTDYVGGHLSVFDRINEDMVRLIDPLYGVPKLREVTLEALYKAMRIHTAANSGGLWFFEELPRYVSQ